jgi:phage-related protein
MRNRARARFNGGGASPARGYGAYTTSGIFTVVKDIEFLGDSLDALRSFPDRARRAAGFALDQVQRGLEPLDWKPMSTVGRGVQEIRVREQRGAFRVIYLARLPEAVYVLHCFEKKTQRTPVRDIETARQRFSELMRTRR